MNEKWDRAVDRFQRGWWMVGDGSCQTFPRLADGRAWTREDVAAERGPLREVVPVEAEDLEVLQHHLAVAGKRAIISLAVALYRLSRKCYEEDGHEYRMVAGRPGSWESALIPAIANEIGGADLAPARVDLAAVDWTFRVINGWIFDPDGEQYVEVAENLARVLGRLVDGRGGWEEVADRWFRHGPHEEAVRNYACGLSRWHQPRGVD